MAEASQDKPDLTNGIPEGDLADGAMLVGRAATRQSWWPVAVGKSSRSAPPAPITAGRSARG
jgi:hypothetical protein